MRIVDSDAIKASDAKLEIRVILRLRLALQYHPTFTLSTHVHM